MSDYLHENAVKKMFDDKPPASNFAFAEVTIRFPIDKYTKFPVKIFTEDDTKKMILKTLEDVRAKIENLYVGDVCAKEHNCDTDVLGIIDQKMEEYKNGQNS